MTGARDTQVVHHSIQIRLCCIRSTGTSVSQGRALRSGKHLPKAEDSLDDKSRLDGRNFGVLIKPVLRLLAHAYLMEEESSSFMKYGWKAL